MTVVTGESSAVQRRLGLRVVVVVWAIIIVAGALHLFSGRGDQLFAAFGAAKRITLPILFGSALLCVVWPLRTETTLYWPWRRSAPGTWSAPLPSWVWILPAVAIFSALLELFSSDESSSESIDTYSQALGLFLGFSVLALLGFRAGRLSPGSQTWTLRSLMCGALLAGYSGIQGLTPFVALLVPCAFVAGLHSIRAPKRRGAWLVVALILTYFLVRTVSDDAVQPTSTAVLGQVWICGFILLLFMLPRAFRLAIAAVFIGVGILMALRQGGLSLLLGKLETADVTIAQRSYEASEVLRGATLSLRSLLFGAGPGSTLDLRSSPDAQTLAAAGRQLAAVDDVHLLTAYFLLKLGVVGVVWLGVLVARILSVGAKVGRSAKIRVWETSLLLFVASGSVNAFPAATSFLANPLIPLFLGMLFAVDLRVDVESREDLPHAIGEPLARG